MSVKDSTNTGCFSCSITSFLDIKHR